MKQLELAKWLKRIIVIIAVIGLLVCFVIAPTIGRNIALTYPEFEYMFFPCLVFIWITAVPFYIALWNVWLICNEISKDNSFCRENAARLKLISKLSVLECILYFVAIIILLFLNLLHPSILLLALSIIFVGIAIAIASAALSHLVHKAYVLKEENDLTI
ncbi:MAG TPA: DUF2975 domain-containing protein [Clostridiales bacterium]|nr:DUF2975 domain-containing protein [Clostridiales bacterium]